MNRSMPPSTIIPELPYPDVRAATEWLCRVFGFKERLQIGSHRAQLVFGTGSMVITKGSETNPAFNVMVRVADIDSHHAHVDQAGAKILNPPADYPYGERQYVVEDIGGHRWTFSQTLSDIDPQTWGGIFVAENNPDAEDFIQAYEQALASQDWSQVEPLVHQDVCVTFSNGTVNKGKAAVQKAFEHNFSLIQDETYAMSNIHWVLKTAETAVYLFEFNWSGLIQGKPAQGAGRGTSVLVNTEQGWKLLIEHLGSKAS